MNIIDKALRQMVDFLLEEELGAQYVGVSKEVRDRWYNGNLGKNETSVNLRMDWELATEALEDVTAERVAELMIKQVEFDIHDVVENGDVDHVSDALLKAFDGSKKRGKEVEDFQIVSAKMFRELKGKDTDRERYEYTLFIRPYIKWSDNGQNDDRTETSTVSNSAS